MEFKNALEGELWMAEYRQSRESQAAVEVAIKNADDFVTAWRQRQQKV